MFLQPVLCGFLPLHHFALHPFALPSKYLLWWTRCAERSAACFIFVTSFFSCNEVSFMKIFEMNDQLPILPETLHAFCTTIGFLRVSFVLGCVKNTCHISKKCPLLFLFLSYQGVFCNLWSHNFQLLYGLPEVLYFFRNSESESKLCMWKKLKCLTNIL